MAGRLPASCTALLLPYASAEVTGLMADAFARLKSLRSLAIAWFDRHAAYAARVLTPQALGKPGTTRRAAEESLRMIAVRHRDDVMAAADTFGPQARAVMGLPVIKVVAGAPADLVAVAAGSLREMVAGRSADRIVLKAGRVVSRTSVSVRTIDTDQTDDVVTALDAWNV